MGVLSEGLETATIRRAARKGAAIKRRPL